MFGDVGGLRDFAKLFISALFGLFSKHFMSASLVQTLFHVTDEKHRSPAKTLASIKPVIFPQSFTLMRAFTFGRYSGDRKRDITLKAGKKELYK